MKQFSFGIIPLKKIRGSWKVLLLQHGKKHWAFPKGKREMDESPEETAKRELKEETNLTIDTLLPLKLQEHYFFTWEGKRIEKWVTYFAATVKGRIKLQREEISDYKWLSVEDALECATYEETKKVCIALYDFLKSS